MNNFESKKCKEKINFNNQLSIINFHSHNTYIPLNKQHVLKFVMNNFESKIAKNNQFQQ